MENSLPFFADPVNDEPLPGHLFPLVPFPPPAPGTPAYKAVTNVTKRWETTRKGLLSSTREVQIRTIASLSNGFVERLAKRKADLPYIEDEERDHIWATRCIAKEFINRVSLGYGRVRSEPDATEKLAGCQFALPDDDPNDVRVGLRRAFVRLTHLVLDQEGRNEAA